MKLSRYLLFYLSVFSNVVVAQTDGEEYYMFPVRPGQENFLSGTMGELRSTHFHTALDIKTSGITGLPIHATADGYVQRIRIGLGGYGNALYIKHENGTMSVYAHLKEFQSDISTYVRKEQYKSESFTVDLYPPSDKFIFKKGEVIALSGNSGSSSGPHLHFEIRDKNNLILDPLRYGFSEIKDNIAPVLDKIAFITLDKESRINGMYGRFEYNVVEDGDAHYLEEPVTLFGNVGVEVYAYDRFNGAKNKNGVVKQTLYYDFEPVFNQNIENLSFNKSRNILAHMNYKRMREGGRRFNKFYVSDGNFLDFYSIGSGKGALRIMDPFEHSIDVRLEDSYGNASQYHFNLNDMGFMKNTKFKNMYFLKSQGFDIAENVLELISNSDTVDCFARIFVQGEEHIVARAYQADKMDFYLWNIQDGLPDSAQICQKVLHFDFKKILPSHKKVEYIDEEFELRMPKYALFDTLYLRYRKTYDTTKYEEYFEFLHPDVPLRQSAKVTLKPAYTYDTSKANIYSVNRKGNKNFIGGNWDDGSITFSTKDLVAYTIASDTIPPKIQKLKSSSKKLRFKIKDEMSGIHSFRAEVDDKWILMYFDAKSGVLKSDDELDISGDFELVIKDNANNYARFKVTL